MYVLRFSNGYHIDFHLLSCAEIFQQCYGGKLEYKERILGDAVEA